MADNEQQYNPSDALLTDVSIKLRDIEEKQNIIKDRVLLIGENLISEKDQNEAQINELKMMLAKFNDDIRKIKLALERINDDSNNYVRKNEFEILQRQFQMFQPLELARMKDVEAMIKQALKSK